VGKVDYTVIDLRGFTPDQIQSIQEYIGNLSKAEQGKIIPIGFTIPPPPLGFTW
jgi:hypothetical protein